VCKSDVLELDVHGKENSRPFTSFNWEWILVEIESKCIIDVNEDSVPKEQALVMYNHDG